MKAENYSIDCWPKEAACGCKSVLSYIMDKNLLLIACGSLTCIRSIYISCRNMDCLDRFVPCIINEKDYALGKNFDILKIAIEKNLKDNPLCGIVLYVSCAEVIMGTDFDDMIDNLDNPDHIPVIPFFRGPLVARRGKLSENAAKIAGGFPTADKSSREYALPVPATDYDGVNELADRWGYERILFTPGACASCITRFPGYTPIKHTRFNDIFVTKGNWDELIALAGENNSDEKDYVIMGTSVPSITMNGAEDFSVVAKPEHLHIAKTNAWRSASNGISNFLLSEFKRCEQRKELSIKENHFFILGYSFISCGEKESVDEAISEYSAENRCIANYWEPNLDYLPEKNIVISLDGLELAKYMEKKYGIPYVSEHILSKKKTETWRKCFRALPENSTICICGEALTIKKLANLAKEENPSSEIRKLIYMPVKEEYAGLKKVLSPDYYVCLDSESLKQALCDGTAFVGDICYKSWMLSAGISPAFRELPHNLIGVNY